MKRLKKPDWRPLAVSLALFCLNAYICRDLFHVGFLRNLDSNEGVFVALSRFFRENFFDQRWFPWFNGGVPIENAYQPLLPVLAAGTGWVSGWSVEHAFHFVLAVFYCLGPVALFLFAWDWSGSLPLSLGAGLLYSVTSFGELLLPVLRVRWDNNWMPLRLYNLIHYAEDPHNLALTLLPIALLFLRRAMNQGSALNAVAAVLSCALVVLANAFGAVDLALGGFCLALALRRGAGTLFATGMVAYLLISPWLPPSLITHIGGDQWGASGSFRSGATTFLAMVLLVAAFAGLERLTRNARPVERFSILFAPWMCAFPLAYFFLGVTLVPQGSRYQLELELSLCLLAGCVCARAFENLAMAGRIVIVLALLLLGVRQTIVFRRASRHLVQPVDITGTIEYKIVHWLERNMAGQRVMISGDVQFLNNVLSDVPQLGGGHEPTVPNWMNRVAVYAINSGDGAGDKDADYSVFWLKAFGTQAVTIAGPSSREHYHPTIRPHKFDGVLPVLWHEEDDTIFAVPQRSRSLAHVIPRSAVSVRRPLHGLDTEPVRTYVAALDDPQLPAARLLWRGNSHFSVSAPLQSKQVLSVQVNYMPGWTATTAGRAVPLHADAIGLMVAEPDCAGQCCEGPCRVEFSYGVTTEAWLCRIGSSLAGLGLLLCLYRGLSGVSRNRRYLRSSS